MGHHENGNGAGTADRRLAVLQVLRGELCAVNDALPDPVPTDVEFNELGLDSLDIVEFVARVEAEFRFSVANDDWSGLSTLDRVIDYVLVRVE